MKFFFSGNVFSEPFCIIRRLQKSFWQHACRCTWRILRWRQNSHDVKIVTWFWIGSACNEIQTVAFDSYLILIKKKIIDFHLKHSSPLIIIHSENFSKTSKAFFSSFYFFSFPDVIAYNNELWDEFCM